MNSFDQLREIQASLDVADDCWVNGERPEIIQTHYLEVIARSLYLLASKAVS